MTIDPNWTLLAIAAFNLATGVLAWDARREVKATKTIAQATQEIALKTEINTNSLTTRLVAASSEAAHAAGKEEGRAVEEQRAANLSVEQKG